MGTKKTTKKTKPAQSIATLLSEMEKRLTSQLDQQGERLDQQSKRLDQQSKRLDQQGERFDQQSKRFDQQGERLDQQSKRFDQLRAEIKQDTLQLLKEQDNRIEERFVKERPEIRKEILNYVAPMFEDLHGKMTKLETRVTDKLGAEIDKLSDKIINFRSDVNSHEQSINQLKHEVETVKRAVVLKET
jgi:uncharacterized coiled-coil DUF342 family protein